LSEARVSFSQRRDLRIVNSAFLFRRRSYYFADVAKILGSCFRAFGKTGATYVRSKLSTFRSRRGVKRINAVVPIVNIKHRPSDRRAPGTEFPRAQCAFEISMFMCTAVHMSTRSLLRSSSIHEPSDPPFRVLYFISFLCAITRQSIFEYSKLLKIFKKIKFRTPNPNGRRRKVI